MQRFPGRRRVGRGFGAAALCFGLCAAALLPGVALADEAGDTTVDAALDVLQRRYDAIEDLRADFEQDAHIASLGRDDRSTGSVQVKRPGRMRWEYSDPEKRVIVLDGETVRVYAPDDRQLQVAPAGAGAFSPTALGFLLGEGDLRDTFTAKRLVAADRRELGIELQPRTDAGFDHLEIWLEPDTHQLRESVVYDLFGNRTRVRFVRIQENTGVDDATFEIDVPDGTEVIDLR